VLRTLSYHSLPRSIFQHQIYQFVRIIFIGPAGSAFLYVLNMKLFSFGLLLLVTIASGAPLIEVLQQVENLSLLNSHIANSTTLTNLLTRADNFTFLAPSNAAFNKWLGQEGSLLTEPEIEETLMYHILRGGFPTVRITATPQFAASNLPNGNLANVTGGQVVEAVADANGTPQFLSANKTITTITTPVRPYRLEGSRNLRADSY